MDRDFLLAAAVGAAVPGLAASIWTFIKAASRNKRARRPEGSRAEGTYSKEEVGDILRDLDSAERVIVDARRVLAHQLPRGDVSEHDAT